VRAKADEMVSFMAHGPEAENKGKIKTKNRVAQKKRSRQ